MALKLAIADYTFPKLDWDLALHLTRALGANGIDIGLFAGRSHLRPEEFLSRPAKGAKEILAAVHAHELEISDLFGQPGEAFEQKAVNHPDRAQRQQAAEFFFRFLELAARCNVQHITLLPGVHFREETYDDSLKRCAEEWAWRVEAASKLGIAVGIEPHIGSIVSMPSQAARLIQLVPGLTLTLDYGHFVSQGIGEDEIEPLLVLSSHLHARAACQGKLQAPLTENAIDFSRMLRAIAKTGYSGYIVLEYVWTEWMGCNNVDNLSETILLRDRLRSLDRELRGEYCGTKPDRSALHRVEEG